MVLNSLNFCLSEKLFTTSSILNEIFARYSNLNCRFFPSSTLNISCHSLLVYRFSVERSAVKHMGFPFMILVSPLLILMFSLCLIFASLISFCLGMFLLGFILYGTLCTSWTWLTISFSILVKFSTIISSKIFSYPFFTVLWDPYNSNVGALDIDPEFFETVLSYFHSFHFILLFRSYVHHFISQFTDLFFCFSCSAIDSF